MTVREIEMRVFVFRDMMGVKRIRDIFKPVRETPRTYCNVFQTYISHKINHVSKPSATPPKKRNSHMFFLCTKIEKNQFKGFETVY